MTDDTTTWLKKNPVINPMRRSLKNSFRFHVPSSEMDSSIISNPDQAKDQKLFIPKMMQRSSMRMLKLKSHEFKVPEPVAKSSTKKTVHGSGSKSNNSGTKVKSKNISVPVRKSFLPVPKSQSQAPAKGPPNEPTLVGLRKSFVPGGSGRKTLARRSLVQKMVALSEVSRMSSCKGSSSQSKVPSETDSVPRSILKKKRNSLRRLSQTSEKPKGAKKVLFDVFENSDLEDKENEEVESSTDGKKAERGDGHEFMALDEPTVFLNFRNSENEEDTTRGKQQQQQQSDDENPSATDTSFSSPTKTITQTNNINSIVKIWKTYRENVRNLEVMRGSLESSLDTFLEHSLAFRNEYESYKKNAQEVYGTLTKLADDLEVAIKRTIAGEDSSPEGNSKSKRKSLEKLNKIRLSDRSKAIKKTSGKKNLSSIKKGIVMEENFGSLERKGFY